MATTGRLEGRGCLIVGGTGGIGLAAARRFLGEGARVAVTGLEGEAPEASEPVPLGSELLGPLRALGPCAGWSLDASRAAEVARVFGHAVEFLGGRLDVLVHVAGISGRRFGDGPLHECRDEGWGRVMEVNALGAFLTNREAVRVMRGQALDATGLRGTVVNLGTALVGSPSPRFFGTVAYAASKGAVQALTLAAAACYAPDRIRFNLIAPGLIDTPMAARAVADPAILEYLRTKQPMAGGPGSADDVAEAALFLCEPASRFVTGTVLAVDGGWSLSEGPPTVGNSP